jgi:heme/copper-type cytochrome/quinol oxidase subunit 2
MRASFGLCIIFLVGLFGFAAETRDLLTLPQVIRVGSPPPADTPIKEVDISARDYEFTPSSIKAPVNTLLRIHLTALDREHGFEIKSAQGSCARFKPGQPLTIEFYTDKTGEYEFSCCKYCGLGHGKMQGKLIVTQ